MRNKNIQNLLVLVLLLLVFVSTSNSQSNDQPNDQSSHRSSHKISHKHDQLCEGFLPDNDLKIPVGYKFAGMSEHEFNQAIDNVTSIYTSIVSGRGGRLRVLKFWDKADVNAMAYRQGRDYVVEIYGGLGRHSVVTPDAVTLITCHEVGHHIGGLPKYSDNTGRWASVEGQADYFATLKCLRKVFRKYPVALSNVDPTAQRECVARHGEGTEENKLCQRIAMASLSAAKLSANLSRTVLPRFDTPDRSVVNQTYERHPQAQCRLDTYFRGSLCTIADSVEINDRDLYTGMCRNIAAEEYGARSKCWFKPTGLTEPPPGPAPSPTPTPPPTDGIAPTPTLAGQHEVTLRNPNQIIEFRWDVSAIGGAAGIYFEVLQGGDFREPNGQRPDPHAMPGGSFRGASGTLRILPARQLPGWGVYKFRIIPLDGSGRYPVGRFSNPAVLNLTR